MTELEKIAYAKSFIDKLANGINPIDNQPVAEYDVVNNVRLTRCFFFVSDILRQVIENGGTIPPKKKAKSSYGKSQKRPTEIGKQIGISLETRNGINGEYQVVVYNKEAQAFILDNIDAIIAS